MAGAGAALRARATFRPVLRAARATFRPVLRAVRATFRPVLRVVRAVLRAVLRAVRATLRPVLRAVRAVLRPVLRAVRAVLRPVVFFAAIIFSLRFRCCPRHSGCTCRLCRCTWQVKHFFEWRLERERPRFVAAGYAARTGAKDERCLLATTTEMSSGTARNAPKGPHIQAQKAIDRKTRKGLSVRRCPMMVGVMNCPSTVVTKTQSTGATKASVRLGKLKRPITNSVATMIAGPR